MYDPHIYNKVAIAVECGGEIHIGTWYRCTTSASKSYFIGKLIDIFSADNNSLTEKTINILNEAMLIQLDINHDGRKVVHVRRSLSTRYPLPWVWFVSPYDCAGRKAILNSLYGTNVCAQDKVDVINFYKQATEIKGENKMTNVENLITLINNKERTDVNVMSKKRDELIDDVFDNSDVGKAASAFLKLATERNEEFCTTLSTLISRSMLNTEDRKKYDDIYKEYYEKVAEIKNKYSELRILIRSVDSFKEAFELLKAYSVITTEATI